MRCGTAANEVDDFDLVVFSDERLIVGPALDDDLVVLDGDAARVDAQLREQGSDGQWSGEFVRIAIQSDLQIRLSVLQCRE